MARLGLLREYNFRQLLLANTFSQIGAQITLIALPLVAVVTLAAPEWQVGVLTAAETAAFVIVGLPAGAWVDRMRRRNVLMVGDIGRGILLGSIPVAWALDALTIWQLYVVALLTGVLTVFFDVAYQSYLPHLVGRKNLVEGNSKLEIVRTTTQVGGPALGGQVVAWLTAPFAITVNAVTFLLSAAFVRLIRKREALPERRPDAHLGREILEGLRFVLGNRLLRAIAACTGSFNLCFTALTSMQVVFLVRDLRLSPSQIGLFFAIGSAGGLLGVALVGPVVRWLGQGPAIWISTGVTAPFSLLLAFAQPGWTTWLAAAGGIMTSVGVVIYNVTQVSFRQGLTPERLLGRMNATMRFLVWGTMPLGGLIGGGLGEWLGARNTILIGAIGACLAFLPTFLSPLRTMRELPTRPEGEPEAAAPEPEPAHP